MATLAGECSDPVYGKFLPRRDKPKPKPSPTSNFPATSFAANASPEAGNSNGTRAKSGFSVPGVGQHSSDRSRAYARPEAPCVLCNQPHRLWHCVSFRSLSATDRFNTVKSHKLCYNCLRSSHQTETCGKKSVCSVQGCNGKHTMWIHCDQLLALNTDNSQTGSTQGSTDANAGAKSAASYASVDQNDHRDGSCALAAATRGTLMPIVEVTVTGDNGSQKCFALLDTGSSQSFCSSDLVNKLGIYSRTSDLSLTTLTSTVTSQSKVVDLSVSSVSVTLEMKDVYVVNHIPVTSTSLDVSKFPHLSDLTCLPAYGPGPISVDLLIGQDNADALVPLEVRRGSPGQPFAMLTMLGWCLNGQVATDKVSRKVISNFVTTRSVEDDVNRLWRIENEGLDDHLSWSREDQSVIDFWDSETKMVNGHFEIPIPWRDRTEPLPNNYVVAKSRLDSLQRKLDKGNGYDQYNSEIDKLLTKGYAEVVPDDEIFSNDRVWYIPHHGVSTVKKPLRVVFDCASKFKGKSLNDRCLQGPDLVNKLLSVLLRFRQHSIAIQADIEAMYNQVRMPLRDRDALRFLWYIDGKLQYYRMTSHLFGGVWCASSSTYALRRTVNETPAVEPLVEYAINHAFYVDDCLISVPDVASGRTVIKEAPLVLANGGFNLTKFAVNDVVLLSEVAESCRSKEVVEFGTECETKALGVNWRIATDEFFFAIQRDLNVPLSRRSMLSLISSIYDPLGLISPIVLGGRLLFQEATMRKLSWDEQIPADIAAKWQSWIKSLASISMLSFPRCIKPAVFDDAVLELHHFSDASSRAYGCCTYIRCVNKDGAVHVQLVTSKSRVAPIKVCTIPRLELQAAVLSVKMDILLRQEMDLQFVGSTFWTDSEIVLKYIANESRRFQVFVANRVSFIHEHSIPDQWKYVSTKTNPADLVTRQQNPLNMNNDVWLNGAEFLSLHKCYWPMLELKSHDLTENDPEVRKSSYSVVCDFCVGDRLERDSVINRIMKHYSSWFKMKRAVVWLKKFISFITDKRVDRKLSVPEMKQAEQCLIRESQRCSFPRELHNLSSGKSVKHDSSLRTLSPYIDVNGLICVGGRIHESDTEIKHPYIIHAKHKLASVIIHDAHNGGHLGVEWVLSVLRKRFWIIKARPLIKKVVKSCLTCRRLYAKPCIQRMADLPSVRLEMHKPAFTFIGVDVFGPFHVKYGRAEIKRYGCLYTCFGTRAVHIEKIDSMDTDSFLNSFRRFAARRGMPETVYSDMGTNLVGAFSELRAAMQDLATDTIANYAVKENVTWHFRPPAASHWGGVWERMIGMVRRIMPAILSHTRLTDEILTTVFCEVEAIINGRPLTKLNDSPDDLTPLTPNHLLLNRAGVTIPPGKFTECDLLRKRWRHVQHLANLFWRKWLRTYLPELQRRIKWTQTRPNLSKGDLVMIADEVTPRNLWPLGLVTDAIRGRDGLVRSVRVKTRKTELLRPVTKIVLLEAAGVNV